MTGQASIAVLDIGKTNVKLCAADAAGAVHETLSHPNAAREGPPWRHHDLEGLGRWVATSLAALARRHPIAHVVPVGHGSGGVLVGDDPEAPGGGAALPMIDYEGPCPPGIDAGYRARAGSFADRGSAVMMASTHAARQLWRMRAEAPEAVAGARWFLNVAQYWAWWLSGVAASEVSAMGAQSHLWNVPEGRWSPIVAEAGWLRLMPAFRPAWEVLGPVRPTLARAHGLPEGLAVHVGSHDSSANFHRYLAAGLQDFTLVSTGTWIVALSREADALRLDEARGMTINADIWGRPVGGALAMGGREFSLVAGKGWVAARADAVTVARLVGRGTMALPSFGANDGQFPGSAGRGRIAGPPPATPAERLSLAVLYAACLTDACARALGGGARLILDGSFPREPLYAALVAALDPGRPVALCREGGVAAGAALLAAPPVDAAALSLDPVAPPAALPDLSAYAARWRAAATIAPEGAAR